jgi:hypothetical protein
MVSISGVSDGPGVPGVRGDAAESDNDGVQGFTSSGARAGVIGVHRTDGVGVKGVSEGHDAVQGFAKHFDHAGVVGANTAGVGVRGQSTDHDGVQGWTSNANRAGVVGTNTSTGSGVMGQCENGVGVHAISTNGTGLVASGGKLAGFFDGNVNVSRDLTVDGDVKLTGGDLAEEFGVVGELTVEPGCVVVLAGDDTVRVSDQAYDRRVAGVASGAGNYRPALVLDRQADADRRPLALTGKVWCKVDADYGPIELGDLLTTSSTPGHAMKAADPSRAFGAVIGKALGSIGAGQGMVPVLVTLQ